MSPGANPDAAEGVRCVPWRPEGFTRAGIQHDDAVFSLMTKKNLG